MSRARLGALGSLIAVVAVVAVIVSSTTGGSSTHASRASPKGSRESLPRGKSVSAQAGSATVPVLAYHVINQPPPQSAVAPQLYVPADEFSAQMDALKANGWHAVTLEQLRANWTHNVSLGSSKPIVISFDNGYASQYENALPVLKRLGWVGVENLQVNGLPPSDGGLSDSQIRGLLAAGWELDTAGLSQPDLTVLDSSQVMHEVTTARQTLRSRYGRPVNWFCYPSGRYNPNVVAAVRAAGFVGSTTVQPGWATPQDDRFRLPRLQVVGGTSPSQLLSQIASAKTAGPVPPASTGT